MNRPSALPWASRAAERVRRVAADALDAAQAHLRAAVAEAALVRALAERDRLCDEYERLWVDHERLASTERACRDVLLATRAAMDTPENADILRHAASLRQEARQLESLVDARVTSERAREAASARAEALGAMYRAVLEALDIDPAGDAPHAIRTLLTERDSALLGYTTLTERVLEHRKALALYRAAAKNLDDEGCLVAEHRIDTSEDSLSALLSAPAWPTPVPTRLVNEYREAERALGEAQWRPDASTEDYAAAVQRVESARIALDDALKRRA